MKKTLTFYFLFCFALFGCKPEKAQIDFNAASNLHQILDQQKVKDNYLALILTKGGCELCDIYKGELHKLNDSGNTLLNADLDIKSISVNGKGIIINQLFRDYSFPMTILFDRNGEIKGFFRGARPEVLLQALKSVYAGKVFYNSKAPFLNGDDTVNFSDEQKMGFVNELFSYANIMQRGGNLNKKQIDSLTINIKKKPYFFNRYLLSKAMVGINDKIAAGKAAESTLSTYHDNLDVMLYQSLKNELHHITDASYTSVNEALLSTPNTEINFGHDYVGAVKTIQIPIKNVGKKELFINNIRVSCDCLKVTWPKEGIPSGKTGEIRVSYKLKQEGLFNQSLFVFSSSPTDPLQINISGTAKII